MPNTNVSKCATKVPNRVVLLRLRITQYLVSKNSSSFDKLESGTDIGNKHAQTH